MWLDMPKNIRTSKCGMIQTKGDKRAEKLALKIDFLKGLIFESAAWFFVIILKFIFTALYEIKIHKRNFLVTKKISFPKADFH